MRGLFSITSTKKEAHVSVSTFLSGLSHRFLITVLSIAWIVVTNELSTLDMIKR